MDDTMEEQPDGDNPRLTRREVSRWLLGFSVVSTLGGVLRFESPETGAKFIEVIIHDVAGVPERVFQWNLAQS